MLYAAGKDVQGVIEVDFLVQSPWMQRFIVEIDAPSMNQPSTSTRLLTMPPPLSVSKYFGFRRRKSMLVRGRAR